MNSFDGGVGFDEGGLEFGRSFEFEVDGRMGEIAEGEAVLPVGVRVSYPESVGDSVVPVVVKFHGQGSAPGGGIVRDSIIGSGRVLVEPTTSRRIINNEGLDHDSWKRAVFFGKEYDDEVEDFRRGIVAALERIEDRYPGREVELSFVGSSLGGTMAVSLSEEFEPHKLVLIAPALSGLDPSDVLIGDSAPDEGELLRLAGNVSEVTVIYGDRDPVIPLSDVERFSEGGRLVVIEGTGHTFGKHDFLPGDSVNKRGELAKAIVGAL